MPLVKIEFDNERVNAETIKILSQAVRDIVSEVTGIDDVFVYANTSQIKIQVAPIEIFIEMSAHKIADASSLITKIKNKISEWKQANNFSHPINLTLIPMEWKIEIGI